MVNHGAQHYWYTIQTLMAHHTTSHSKPTQTRKDECLKKKLELNSSAKVPHFSPLQAHIASQENDTHRKYSLHIIKSHMRW